MEGAEDPALELLRSLTEGSNAEKPRQTAVVLGASGPLGRAVVDVLAGAFQTVKAVVFPSSSPSSPFPNSVQTLRVDPRDVGGLTRACGGAGVIYDCFEPPYANWHDALSAMTERVVTASIEVGASLVFGSPLFVSEVDNQVSEEGVLSAHNSNLIRTVVIRMAQLYGPHVVNKLWESIFTAVAKDEKAHWMGDMTVLRSLLYVHDAASMMVAVGSSPSAFGRTWSLSGPRSITGEEFMKLVYRAAGKEPNFGHWGRGIMLTGIIGSDARKFLELPYDYYRPFTIDGSEFERAFPSVACTSHEKAIGNTYEWFRNRTDTRT